ncbi:MAG: hypothetical protein M1812_001250 [Candelaria pacifica]|nr:MAG: hypothetical protein M1812_001250 [Candelaria pacifica]
MSTNITLPPDYGYVVLTAFSTFLISAWHGARAGSYRKLAKVTYPAPYASNEIAAKNDAAYAFNCAQRAHANFDEHHASTLTALLLAGTRYPIATSVLGMAWGVNRVIYAIGYTRRDWGAEGKGRYWGIASTLAEYALFGMAGWTGWEMLV